MSKYLTQMICDAWDPKATPTFPLSLNVSGNEWYGTGLAQTKSWDFLRLRVVVPSFFLLDASHSHCELAKGVEAAGTAVHAIKTGGGGGKRGKERT